MGCCASSSASSSARAAAAETGEARDVVEVLCPPRAVDEGMFELHEAISRGYEWALYPAARVEDREERARRGARWYTVKCYFTAKLENSAAKIPNVVRERRCLELFFQSPFLMHLLHAFQTPTALFLVMPSTSGETLKSVVDRDGPMSEEVARFYAAEMLLGLESLHARKILYRNMAPAHALLTEDGHVRLSELDICVELDPEHGYRTQGKAGVRGFVAPECLRGEAYSWVADTWSFGVSLFYLLHARLPHEQGMGEELITESMVVRFREGLSQTSRDLFSAVLNLDARKRPSVREVRHMAWFAGVNWREMRARRVKPPYTPPAVERKAHANLPHAEEPRDAAAFHAHFREWDFRTRLVGNRDSDLERLVQAGPPGLGRVRSMDETRGSEVRRRQHQQKQRRGQQDVKEHDGGQQPQAQQHDSSIPGSVSTPEVHLQRPRQEKKK